MKRLFASVVIVLSFAAVAMAGEIKKWKIDELMGSDKLIQYTGKSFRDTALQPLSSADNAMKGVLEKATEEKVENLLISFEGERIEKRWGIQGTYYVVEAFEVIFLDPSDENIGKVLNQPKPTYLEFASAIKYAAKSPKSKDFAKILLGHIKNISEYADVNAVMIEGYANIMQKDSVTELTKIMKYHSVDLVRVYAGKQLITMGESSAVEDMLAKGEKDKTVRTNLERHLNKSLSNRVLNDKVSQDSIPELTKILKTHHDDKARIDAGIQLIKLGESSVVEDVLKKNEKSTKVKVALKKALMD